MSESVSNSRCPMPVVKTANLICWPFFLGSLAEPTPALLNPERVIWSFEPSPLKIEQQTAAIANAAHTGLKRRQGRMNRPCLKKPGYASFWLSPWRYALAGAKIPTSMMVRPTERERNNCKPHRTYTGVSIYRTDPMQQGLSVPSPPCPGLV